MSVDFDRGDSHEGGGRTLAWGSLASGGLAMLANMLWLPIVNVVFSLLALGLGWLAVRRAKKGSDDHGWAVAAWWLALGNLAVLMVVLALQLAAVSAFLAAWLALQ